MLAPPPSFSQDSIGDIAEQVVQFSYYRKQIAKNQHVKKKVEINISDLLNMEVLDEIRQEFLKYQDESGHESLPANEFIEVLSRYLPKPDIEKLYQKIDVNDDGNVDWQEFTGFLTTSNSDSGPTTKIYNKIFTLKLEQVFEESNHKDMIDFICFSAKPIPVIATAGRDGQIIIWNQSDLRRIGSIVHHDKNEVFLNNMMSKLTIQQRAMVAKSSAVNPITVGKKNVLITSLAMMPLSGHVCVSSGDCCVSLYDLSTQEICGRITSLSQLPTSLETFVIIDKIKETCNQYLVIGDAKGKIFRLEFDSEFGMSVDAGSKKKNQILMTEAVHKMESALPHRDWISSMVFVPDLSRLVIGSMDGTVSLFNLHNMSVDRVFHGHKVGVRCVAWCNSNKFLLSAGTDRAILIWDPYTLRINMTIGGLSALIVTLTVNDRMFEIIAVLEDKTIRTWDAVTFESIATIQDTSFQLPTNLLTAALFVPSLNTLYTAGSRLSCWQPDRATEALVNSNDDDLLAVLYNPTFFLILIITRAGVVTTFQLSDGSVIVKFTVVTDPSKMPVIPKIDEKSGQILPYVTHAVFDFSFRRLIIIAKECNEIQIWNFHNGQCLKVIRPRLPTSLHPTQPTPSPAYAHGLTTSPPLPNPRPYLITTLSYQHIYYGPLRLPKKYIVFGTDIGVTSCLIELGDSIEEEAVYNLVLPDRTGKGLSDSESKSARSVVWISTSSENKVLVRYRNHDVVQWDLEKSTAGVELCRRSQEIGETFVALRRKVVASSVESATFEKPFVSNQMNEKKLQELSLEEQDSESRPDTPEDSMNSRAPILALPPPSHVTLKANGKRAPTITQNTPVVTSNTATTTFPRGTIGRPSVSWRQSRIIKPSMIQNPLVGEEGGTIIRTPVAPAAVVGVARSTFRRATLNPLEESVESSLSEFTTPSHSIVSPARRSTRVSILNPGRPAGSRVVAESSLLGSTIVESANEIIEEGDEINAKEEGPVAQEVPQTTEPQSSGESESPSKPTVSSEQTFLRNEMIRINFVVVLKMEKVAIGSCSDDLIRIWDLDTGRVICSCSTLSKSMITKAENAKLESTDVSHQVTSLCTNEKQDILVGGYETGEVKVWLIHHPSILNLKSPHQQDGLTVPPLQLLAEWSAHVTAIFTVQCITLNEEDWGTHETFLLTSGHDQESHLWTSTGLMVGTFGTSSWDIQMKNTWKMKPTDHHSTAPDAHKIIQNAVPPPPHSPKKSKVKTTHPDRSFLVTSSRSDAREDHLRPIRLQLHMEKLAEKHAKPHPSVTAIHDEVFSESAHRHPIVDIMKKGYLSKKLKAAMAQNSHLSIPIIPPHGTSSHEIKR